MGETAIHVGAVTDWYETMQLFLLNEPMGMVLSNVFLYYEEGNPKARRAPDVMIIKDVPKEQPDTYKTWEYGKAPDVVFEFSSSGTWMDDLGDKKTTYEQLQIREYFLYDPQRRCLDEPLMGFRWQRGRYVSIQLEDDGSLVSRELGLGIHPDGPLLRGVNLRTGERLLHAKERELALRAQRQEAEQARALAESERQRAEGERTRAEQERARADQAEAEIARLKALLSNLQGPNTP